jgi:hypothetical protein
VNARILSFPGRPGRDLLAAFEFRCGCGAITFASLLVREVPQALHCAACDRPQPPDAVIDDVRIPAEHLARANEPENR